HDHTQFEIFCYSNSVAYDHTTEKLKTYADTWRDITYLSDEQAANLIRQDKIDILVDFTGHIGGTRLMVFARKPAPIQITYIGYQGTTGMAAMDYRLTDDYSDPPGMTEHLHTERLLRLPRTFFCYLPAAIAPEITQLPALSRGYVTFGSFNNYA